MFTFSDSLKNPAMVQLSIMGKRARTHFYAENVKMEMSGHVDSLREAKFTGSEINDDNAKLEKKYKELSKKMKINEVYKELYNRNNKPTKERRKELEKKIAEFGTLRDELAIKFIKENPSAYFSAILIGRSTHGASAQEIEEKVNLLSPKLKELPMISSMLKRAEKMKTVEIGIDKIMANASNVSYKVDDKFKGGDHKKVKYLAMLSDNKICALERDGTIKVLNTTGKTLSSFKPEMKGAPSSVAVDKKGNIYVLTGLHKKVKRKIRGKEREINSPSGVECYVFNNKGKQIRNMKLSEIITATGARVVDETLIVSDCRKAKIVMFDSKTGKKKSTIKNMRPCCGILDFSVNNNNEILVANLGAFRVQSYDFTGKNIVAFGKRGKTDDDFHGCCNPVSVAYLSNGAIVTVEKDPTRIKIYSKEGAKQIDGIEELVQGCSYIPMIVDGKDNLYLASPKKGMIKCVSI